MEESAPASALAPGVVLGKYRLTSKLGEGGMGMVFAAVHEKLGREVAIKVLRKEFASTEEVMIRFQHEAEAVTRIGHANIVAVYDFGRLEDGGLYYVMEKVPGITLTRRMKQMALTELEIRDVFTQLLSALQAAHDLGVVHRDLKPDNVVIVDRHEGEKILIKLLDFGVAKMRDDQRAGPLTTAGALMGTPRYMAPEQIKAAEKADGRVDIYAAGVMLYEALAGKPPFEGKMMQLLMAHMNQPPEPPSIKAKEVGGTARDTCRWDLLDPVVLKALAKDPNERYQSCRELSNDLEAALRSSIRVTSPEAARTTTGGLPQVVAQQQALMRKQSRRSFMLAGGAALGLFSVAGGAALFIRKIDRMAGPELEGEGARQTEKPKEQEVKGLPHELAARAVQIIDRAQGGGAEARRSVIEAIEEVRSRRFLGRLQTALQDDNPAVRRAAAQAAIAVGRAGDDALLQALREAAARSTGAVAVEIAAARLALGDAAAAEDLQAAARSGDAALRLRATLALSHSGRAPASQLRQAYVKSRKTTGVRPALRRAVLARLFVLEDPAVVKEIEDALKDGADTDVLLEAAEVLARAGDERGRELLIKHAPSARDNAAEERTRADPAAVLAQVDDARAVALLLPLLKDRDPKTRSKAVAALGSLSARGRWKMDIPAVGPLLDDPQGRVAVSAAVALLGQADSSS